MKQSNLNSKNLLFLLINITLYLHTKQIECGATTILEGKNMKECLKCGTTTETKDACISCSTGYYPDYNTPENPTKGCLKCPIENCVKCDSEESCSECLPGHRLVPFSVSNIASCEKFYGCQHLKNEENCFICEPGFTLLPNGNCLKCPENCLECDHESKCIKPKNGFYIYFGVLKSCEAGFFEGCGRCDGGEGCFQCLEERYPLYGDYGNLKACLRSEDIKVKILKEYGCFGWILIIRIFLIFFLW